MTGPLSEETNASQHNLTPQEVLFLFALTFCARKYKLNGTKLYCATLICISRQTFFCLRVCEICLKMTFPNSVN